MSNSEAVPADHQRLRPEMDELLAKVIAENDALRTELGRVQAQMMEDHPKITSENNVLRTELGRLHAQMTEEFPRITSENNMLRAELGRLHAQMADEYPKITSENSMLRTELGRLQQQIIDNDASAGMPLHLLINRYRTFANVPSRFRSQQIAFLHIGKTAGTSLHSFLRNAMPDTPTFQGSPELFDQVSADDIHNHGLVLGHFSYNHVRKLRQPAFLITFLRDPVDRVLSSYSYLREAKSFEHEVDYIKRAITLAQELSLDDFMRCTAPEVRMFTMDHQSYALTSDFRAARKINYEELIKTALGNLEAFGHVGFAERFDDSLNCLSILFDKEPPKRELRLNQTVDRVQRSTVSAETIALIETLNAADIALYEQAMQQFSG